MARSLEKSLEKILREPLESHRKFRIVACWTVRLTIPIHLQEIFLKKRFFLKEA